MKGVCSPHAWLTPAALRSLNLFLRKKPPLSPPSRMPLYRGSAPEVPGPRGEGGPPPPRDSDWAGLPRPSRRGCLCHPPPPGLPLQHTPNRLAAVSFYLILLLKLWHYLQWQWYRPAQDPLKQICLQVKSKKYFDS